MARRLKPNHSKLQRVLIQNPIVLGMSSDPKPHDALRFFSGQRPVADADADRPELLFADFFEVQ